LAPAGGPAGCLDNPGRAGIRGSVGRSGRPTVIVIALAATAARRPEGAVAYRHSVRTNSGDAGKAVNRSLARAPAAAHVEAGQPYASLLRDQTSHQNGALQTGVK
jgi:hypothetical protein